jgi:restriction endonuclease Mrr
MRSTERFNGLATIYGQARPTYPLDLVHWCLEQATAPDCIVDLGCGTGISTRLFATTGRFTSEAQKEANRDGVPPIELIDGERMVSLFEKYELGLKPKTVIELVPEFFRSFES